MSELPAIPAITDADLLHAAFSLGRAAEAYKLAFMSLFGHC